METKVNDAVFGSMTYKHLWEKREALSLFGKENEITVAARAYSGKPITDAQRKSYKAFIDDKASYLGKIEAALREYAAGKGDVASMVKPKTLVFMTDGTAVLLLDCTWDEEHGVGVQLMPDIKVGSQDIFL